MNATAGSGRVQKKTLDAAISGRGSFGTISTFHALRNAEPPSRDFRELSFRSSAIRAHWTLFADLVNAAVKLDENISDKTIYEIFRLTGVCVE